MLPGGDSIARQALTVLHYMHVPSICEPAAENDVCEGNDLLSRALDVLTTDVGRGRVTTRSD